MVSQSLRWFRTILGDPRLNKDDEVQRYLQQYDEAMYSEFNRSNFYSILGEWFRDAGSIGTATLYTEEDMGRGSSVHIPIHPREIFISENRYGNVDTVFRKFFLTAKQAVQKFGDERLHRSILDSAEKDPEKRYEFIHAVFPNDDRMLGSLLSEHKAVSSVYLQKVGRQDIDDGFVIKKSGFDINPYAVWRLRKNSDEIYGYSPAADAMVSIKKLNQISKTLQQAAHLAVEPAMNIPEHMRGNTRFTPNGHNYFDKGGDKATAVHTGINYPIGVDREDKIERIIEDKYRVEFFLILSRSEREKTATEIMELQAEKSVLLGPQIDRMITDGLNPVFDIVADIAEKGKRLPPPPQILVDAVEQAKAEGRNPATINPTFIGPLAQAQKRIFQMQPIRNGINELAQAAAVFPDILKRVNQDKLSEAILDSTNFPQGLMFTDAEFADIKAAEAQALAQQQAQQQMEGMADSYPKISKKAEEGSPAAVIGEAL